MNEIEKSYNDVITDEQSKDALNLASENSTLTPELASQLARAGVRTGVIYTLPIYHPTFAPMDVEEVVQAHLEETQVKADCIALCENRKEKPTTYVEKKIRETERKRLKNEITIKGKAAITKAYSAVRAQTKNTFSQYYRDLRAMVEKKATKAEIQAHVEELMKHAQSLL